MNEDAERDAFENEMVGRYLRRINPSQFEHWLESAAEAELEAA